jgi:hypothetical protein
LEDENENSIAVYIRTGVISFFRDLLCRESGRPNQFYRRPGPDGLARHGVSVDANATVVFFIKCISGYGERLSV